MKAWYLIHDTNDSWAYLLELKPKNCPNLRDYRFCVR